MQARFSAPLIVAACALACSGGSSSSGGGGTGTGGATITISNYTFSPSNLTVAPGTTVTVINRDGMAHSVTSQSAPGRYIAGSVNGVSFDTGPFTGTKTFTIPASAPSGTVVPFFCTVHRNAMANSGQITISGSSTGGGADAGTGGGGGGGGGGY